MACANGLFRNMAIAIARRIRRVINTFGFGIDTAFSNCTHYYNMEPRSTRLCHPNGIDRAFHRGHRDYNTYTRKSWHEFEVDAISNISASWPRRTLPISTVSNGYMRHVTCAMCWT